MYEKDKKIVFKEAYKRFTEALTYMVKNESELKKDPKRWKTVQQNFHAKFEKPMDEAWAALLKEDRKGLAPVYLHRKATQDKYVKKILKTFNGKIVNVKEVEDV